MRTWSKVARLAAFAAKAWAKGWSRAWAASWAMAAVVAALAWAMPASAQDGTRGRLLYDNQCKSCHSTEAHWRDGRKARSMAELQYWVRRWADTLGLDWGEAEVADVVAYLNGSFYHF